MAASAFKGPLVAYGTRAPLGSGGSENPDLGPSLFWGGSSVIDPRVGWNVTRAGALGFGAVGESAVIKAAPSAISAVNLAAAQVPTAGTALTLVSASGAGITLVGTATRVWPSGNIIPATALAIDGLPGVVAFGRAENANSGYTTIGLYDPTTFLARNVRITSVGNDSGGTFLVSGADVYGYPQTELITGANAGVASGKKAFKFIYSVTPGGTLSGSNVSVGTGDVYGLPMRADNAGEFLAMWNSTWVTAPTFVAADTTSPATSSTGDVRGTVAAPTASDGTKQLVLYCMPAVSNLGSLFGVTPA